MLQNRVPDFLVFFFLYTTEKWLAYFTSLGLLLFIYCKQHIMPHTYFLQIPIGLLSYDDAANVLASPGWP